MRLTGFLGAAAGSLSLLAASPATQADDIADAICAVQQAVVCEAYAPCQRALPGAVNLPALLRIHKDNKTVETRRESGETRTSAIESAQSTTDAYLLQGSDESSPWSMRVTKSTGRFIFAVAGQENTGYMGFGVCSAKILGDGS